MGQSQSTRRVTFENDTPPSHMINVTDSVVKRLKGGTEVVEEEDSQAQVRKSGIPSGNVQANAGFHYCTHCITSHQIQQERQKELQQNNEYWEKRIAKLQESQEEMNRLMEIEYIKAAAEMEALMPRIPPTNAIVPCQDKKDSVISCYKKNSKQPLLCSKEVEAFTSCMTSTRIKLQGEGKLG